MLPFAIYWVGTQLLGEYAPDASALALAEQIWLDLLSLDPFSLDSRSEPLSVVLLLRARASRVAPEAAVIRVTDPARKPIRKPGHLLSFFGRFVDAPLRRAGRIALLRARA